MTPLSMVETREMLEEIDKENPIIAHIHKFSKMKKEDALKLKEEISGLNFMKVKAEHIIKIVDILPEDASDLNKIFSDVSLDEEESKKIIEIVKGYK